MNIQKTLVVGLLALLVFTTACEDFLYQEPRLSQTNELTLSTFEGLQNATLGVYTPLYSSDWYGRDFVVTADLKGGNAKKGPISSGRFFTEYLWNNTPDASHGLWTRAYDLIGRANNVLEVIDGGFEEAGVEQADIDQLAAECKFLRGLAYFDLARLFCQPIAQGSGASQLGVPVVLTYELGQPVRNTLGEVYAQIESDLLDAEADLAEVSPNGGTDARGWATKFAAQALLARFYLYTEQWQDAANYAGMVINSGEFPLYTADEYTTWDNGGVWGTDGGSEVIFEVYGAEGNSSHSNWDVISYIMSPLGYGDINASLDVYNLYEDGDVRKGMFRNYEPNYVNDLWSLKYPGKAPDGNLREDNIPVLRISEMYLIRAEAILNGASAAGATASGDLNAIREIRGASLLDAGNTTLSSVYLERRMELCYEGHELFDLARTGRGLTRTDYSGAVNQNISFPDYRWAMPIPQEELNANENMEQNPEY
ncbi:MAG: RagB/SusD family nutrient uptake outer membrane protein [Bacteroidales bacterium]